MQSEQNVDDTRLGAILLENPLMREEDIERCLEIQGLTGGTRPLGEILVEEGVISRATLEDLLHAQAARRARVAEEQAYAVACADPSSPAGCVREAMEHGATDLLVSEGRPMLIRVGGSLRRLGDDVVGCQQALQFLHAFAGPEATSRLAEQRSLTNDLLVAGVARGRLSAFRHFDGLCITVRLHPIEVRDGRQSNLPVELLKTLTAGKGMILVAGEVHSGVSETLTTLLHLAAVDRRRFIVVLDSDFEYPPPDRGAVVVRRRVGVDTESWVSGLRAAICESPDMIFVGDVSDQATFELALRAAEAGHVVVAGLRARSVVAAFERILNGYPAYDVPRVRSTLAAVIHCVVAQGLLPRKAGDGDVLANEVLLLNDAAREVVRSGPLSQLNLLLRLESSECGHSLDDSLIDLLAADMVRFEEAFRRADDKTRILQAAQKK